MRYICVLEFKINSDADTAFQQIIDKKYSALYSADSRIKIGININFNGETREMDVFKIDNLVWFEKMYPLSILAFLCVLFIKIQ